MAGIEQVHLKIAPGCEKSRLGVSGICDDVGSYIFEHLDGKGAISNIN